MEPFSADILTILSLISICWTGVSCLAVLIFALIFLCRYCAKHRRPKMVKPIQTPSVLSADDDDDASAPVTPVPIKTHDRHKPNTHRYETPSVLDDLSYSNHPNKYQQQDYMHDDNDETTVKNENRTFVPRPSKRGYQTVKPMANLRLTDRHTPYPADVLARERAMNNTRFPMDNKY